MQNAHLVLILLETAVTSLATVIFLEPTLILIIRAGLDLESGLEMGWGAPLIGREARTRLFKFTP